MLQAAEQLLAACAATEGHGRTAVSIYQHLVASGAALPASAHADGLRGLLAAVHTAENAEVAAEAAAAAVALLEQRHAQLAALGDGRLPDQVLAAAAYALQYESSISASLAGYQAATAVQVSGASGEQAAQQLYAALQPPAQLAAWGLRLKAGVRLSNQDSTSLQEALSAMASAARHSGGQLWALLRLVPLWVPPCQPSPQDWSLALAATRPQLDGASGSGDSKGASLVAQQVAAVCGELQQRAGDDWTGALSIAAAVRCTLGHASNAHEQS